MAHGVLDPARAHPLSVRASVREGIISHSHALCGNKLVCCVTIPLREPYSANTNVTYIWNNMALIQRTQFHIFSNMSYFRNFGIPKNIPLHKANSVYLVRRRHPTS